MIAPTALNVTNATADVAVDAPPAADIVAVPTACMIVIPVVLKSPSALKVTSPTPVAAYWFDPSALIVTWPTADAAHAVDPTAALKFT